MIDFLKSPLRVFVAINRILVLFCLIAPFIVFGLKGIILLPIGISAWMLLTLTVYGPKIMMNDKTPWRVWIWNQFEVWWIIPTED